MGKVSDRLWDKAGVMRIPLTGAFELLPICNLHCKMCYVRKSMAEVNAQGGLLPAEQWLDFARQARDEGMLYPLLTGGEPFVRKDFQEIMAGMEKLGFDLLPGEHPIVPVMLYDPKVAHEFARRMLDKGVYVVAFCYPVVPKGKDRIRTQISAGHTREDLDFAIRCFGEVKAEMGL